MHAPVSEDIKRCAPRLWFYGGAVLLIVIFAGLSIWYSGFQRGTPAAAPAVTIAPAPLVAFDPASDALGVSMGSANATVVVREFADFQCPSCAGFEPNLERMRKQYVDTGKVRFVFFDFPLVELHKNALTASQLARCAGLQGQYWQMHDLLYARQQEWAEQSDPSRQFESFADDLRLDAPKLMRCLKQDETLALVKKSSDYGDSLGVHATPSYGINGVGRAGGISYDDLKALIEQQLNHPTLAPVATTKH